MQKRGGRGRTSRSSLASVGGLVNGIGTDPPRSIVEQEDTSRAHPAPIANNVGFITTPSIQRVIRCPEVLTPARVKILWPARRTA